MFVRTNLRNSKKIKNLISQEEILKLIDNERILEIFPSFINDVQKDKIDVSIFDFIFRKIYPGIQKIIRYPNLKKFSNKSEDEETDRIIILGKAVSCATFGYVFFQRYFCDEDIIEIFECLEYCNEIFKKPLQMLLQQILICFNEFANVYKEIIANKLIEFKINHKLKIELDFIFKLISLMIDNQNFGEDTLEYYTQYILPLITYFSVGNLELSTEIISKICSIAPECQRSTLRYFCKIYRKIGSNEQIKILEMTSKVIHTNFFHQSKSYLQWEFCEIINMALKSESFIVIDTVIELIDNSTVKKFIENNIRIILPKIFENIYRLSKKFWRQEQRFKAIQAIGNILNIDLDVFETCLIEYNKSKHLKTINNLDINRSK